MSHKIVIEAFTYVLQTRFGVGKKIKESSIFSSITHSTEGI